VGSRPVNPSVSVAIILEKDMSMKLYGIGAVMLAGLAAGCVPTQEMVHDRRLSPDGRFEAVMMVCRMPADVTIPEMVVAVFEDKGRGCGTPSRYANSEVTLTHAYGPDEAGATIEWQGDRLIFRSTLQRTMISGTRAPKNHGGVILLEGPIAETYDWNSKQAD